MTSAPAGRLLTIGDLAARTGVPPATLRSWESRYGFPQPVRVGGGHRRYPEAAVAAVLQVLDHKEAGFGLEAAVRLVADESSQPESVYAELRRRYPAMAPQLLSKASLVALSWAIEDECCARAERPLLFGAFQRNRFLRESWSRWAELSRTARAAVVFADIAVPAVSRPGVPIEVSVPRDAPLNREWVVVCDAPDLPACLAAVERPGHQGDPDPLRRFEAVWSVDPGVVRHASRVAAALADEYRPGWRSAGLAGLDDEPREASGDLQRATGLLTRMMGYLDSRT